MNDSAELDIGPLSWVKDEIDLALARVVELLQKYGGTQDAAVLAEARTHLHQAHGALAIVGLDGITEFSHAIERLLDALAEGHVPWSPELHESAEQGISALVQYLGELLSGRPDQSLRLLPAYRRLCEARGAQDVVDSDLFFPDLTQRPPRRDDDGAMPDEEARQSRLKAARLGFERGLTKWLKQDASGLRDMRNSIAMIERLQTQPASRAFWWVTLAYFDAMAAGGIEDDDDTRRLCRRIDAQVTKLLDGTQAVAERLMRDVLFEVATASASNEHIELVRAAYRLRDLVPEVAGTSDPQDAVLHEMQERLAAAGENWDQFCAGAAIALPRFHEHSAQLVSAAQKLGQTDLVRLVSALANSANLLRKNPLLHSEALATEVATALLLAENAVAQFVALPADFTAEVDVLTGRLSALQRGDPIGAPDLASLQALAQRAGNRISRHHQVRELRAQLLLVEQGLDAFFRDAENTGALASAAEPLRKTAAMFGQMGEQRAVAVVEDCLQSIGMFARPDHERQVGEFEEVARKISALGFFVGQLQLGAADLDALLAPAVSTSPTTMTQTVEAELSDMARMAHTLVGVMMGREGAPPQDEQTREALLGELKQNLRGMRENARLVADDALEQQADAALEALDSNASPERIDEIVAPMALEAGADLADNLALTGEDSARLAEASADEVDEELLTIFIEEVVQVLDTVGVQLYRSMAKPDRSEHLAILRRCFHTLKGSSRMVGLLDFSDAARAVETTLGMHLHTEKPATPELHAMVDTAQHIVSDWVERLQRRASAPDATPLLQQCVALKAMLAGNADTGADAPAQPEPKVSIGSLQMSRKVYEIYLEEARGYLQALGRSWQRKPTAEMLRATHSLAGASASIGLAPIQTLAHALETTLERFEQAQTETSPAQDTTLQLAQRRLLAMVTSVAEQKMPEVDVDLTARLATIVPPDIARPELTGHQPEAAMPAPAENVDNDLLPLFMEEWQDLRPAVGKGFEQWRGQGDAVALQRLLHTLKGSARMAGLAGIGESIHKVETGIAEAQARSAGNRVAEPLIGRLASEFDKAAAEIEALGKAPDEGSGLPQKPTLRVSAELVDTMVTESGEISIARSRIDGGVKTLRSSIADLADNVSRLRSHLRELEVQADASMQSQVQARGAGAAGKEFDPLEMDRYTRLQELTRILAESVNDVATVEHSLVRDLDQVDAALSQQARLSRELTQRLMGVRMVPFSSVAERMQRVVQQTADEVGKKAELIIDGLNTDIDRSVLERMTGPMEHLLRNAVVHGIENGEGRRSARKSLQGTIRLALVQSGNEIDISISDDGAGLDFARIRSEAIRRGLLRPDQQMDDAKLTQLIYQPGFTTASELSTIAGRGVGMDVVRTETAALGGRIDVQSATDSGTRFSLHLPLTLAVIPALLVKSGARTYAIPSAMVAQAREFKPEAMLQLRSEGTVEWQGQGYALNYLPRLLGDPNAKPVQQRRHWVVLLRAGVQCLALEVDALIGNEEVVIKNIGPQLARVPGITGATVLGDGEVVLIVNPVALAGRTAANLPQAPARQNDDEAGPPAVMVVDDSLTVRKITGRLLERAGYRVITAKDGVDALEQLSEVKPSLILADIEMPRMDGFELLRRLRADGRFKALPVIMITSRTADKHRNFAFELGASDYLGKPYDEEALLHTIAGYLKNEAR